MGGQTSKPCCGCGTSKDSSDAPGVELPAQVTEGTSLEAPPDAPPKALGSPPDGPAEHGDEHNDEREDEHKGSPSTPSAKASPKDEDEHPSTTSAQAAERDTGHADEPRTRAARSAPAAATSRGGSGSSAKPSPLPPLQDAASRPLSNSEKEAVVKSWMKVEDLGAQSVGLLLFQTLFKLAPETLQLFSFRNEPGVLRSSKLKAHGIKVVNFVGVAVGMLHRLEALVPILQELGVKHLGFGICPQADAKFVGHYDVVGRSLIDTLRAGLGEVFDQELEVAWTKVFRIVSATMREVTAEMAAKVASASTMGGRVEGCGQAAPKQKQKRPAWGRLNSSGLLMAFRRK